MLLPRWVQRIAGLVLVAWGGASLAGSIAILRMEPIRNWLFTKTVGVLLLFGSAWVLSKAVRLIRGPGDRPDRFMSIWVMRGFAVVFGALPFLALLAGTASGWQVILGGGVNLVIAYRLLLASDEPDSEDDDLAEEDVELDQEEAEPESRT